MAGASYQLGVDAAVVLAYGTVNQAVIKGLNKLGLPQLMRNVIKVTEFRTDFDISFTGSGEFGTITFGGNLVLGDTKGQDKLKQYLKANTKIKDCRVYLNLTDFMTVDLANNEDSCFQVSKVTPGQADKNGIFSLDSEMVCGGPFAYFTKHMADTSLAFVAGSSGVKDTITDAASGFVTAGFAVGDTIIIEGSTGNDGQYLVTAVAAGTLTLDGEGELTTHAAEEVTIHGGTL